MDEWLVEDCEAGIGRDLSFSNWCSDDGAQATSSGRLSFDSASSGADSEATGGTPQPAAPWQLAFETEAQARPGGLSESPA